MYGIDISNHQRHLDLSSISEYFDFAIVKATEGVGFVDKSFLKFTEQLTRMNKLIGYYHFCRPDNHPSYEGARKEAEWFIKKIKDAGLLGKSILCLDWETATKNNSHLLRTMTDYIIEETGITPFIYGNREALNEIWRVDKSLLEKCYVWFAYWPTVEEIWPGSKPIMPNGKEPPYRIDIWQHTSNGRFSGYSGRVDLDISHMSVEDWEFISRKKEKPNKEILSDDMRWSIDQGIFKGFSDGTFRPNEPITRSQAASLLRRFDEYETKKIHDMVKRMLENNLGEYKVNGKVGRL